MNQASKMAVLGAVGVLMIAGLAIVLMDQSDPSVGAKAPSVAIQSLGTEESDGEAIMVTTEVEGQSVPLSGARVMVCRMNVTGDGEQWTFRVMEAVQLQAGEDGRVMYNFSEGSKYMVCAENHEQRGYANMNMNETEASLCYTHEWNWKNMNGQSFTHSGSGQGTGGGSGNGSSRILWANCE